MCTVSPITALASLHEQRGERLDEVFGSGSGSTCEEMVDFRQVSSTGGGGGVAQRNSSMVEWSLNCSVCHNHMQGL